MKEMFLDPITTRFEMAPDGTLRVQAPDRCGLRVSAMLAFPLSHPGRYVVLQDGGGTEVGVIKNLTEVPQPSRAILEAQLYRRYFLPSVTAIVSTTERFGSSVWELETDRGPRQVTTKMMNEAVTEVEPNRYLITDLEGNRYEIKKLTDLDPDSRARFLGKM